MNLQLNVIKSVRRYNDNKGILLQAMVPILCRLVDTAVEFLKTVAYAGQVGTNQRTLASLVPCVL